MLLRRVARPLLAGIFIQGGIAALRDPKTHADMAAPVLDRAAPVIDKVTEVAPIDRRPPNETLVKVDAVVKIGAGTLLALGRFPRLSAAALAPGLIATTAAAHRFWEVDDPNQRMNQQVHFIKNLGLLGGLMLAAADTEGKPSLAWRARHAGHTSAATAELFHKDVTEGLGHLSERAGQLTGAAADAATRASGRASEVAVTAGDRLAPVAARAGERASEVAGRVGERATEVAGRVGERAAEVAGRVGEQAADVAARTGDRVAPLATRAGEKVSERAEHWLGEADAASSKALKRARKAGEKARKRTEKRLDAASKRASKEIDQASKRASKRLDKVSRQASQESARQLDRATARAREVRGAVRSKLP